MNIDEYKALSNEINPKGLLSVSDLVNKTPRTLAYGYYSDGTTHHVYLGADGQLHRLLYRELSKPTAAGKYFQVIQYSSGPSAGVDTNESYLPTKRLYPESCDFEFMSLLRDFGVDGCFTNFNPEGDAHRKAHRARNGFTTDYAGHIETDGGIVMQNIRSELTAMVGLRPFTDMANLPLRLFDSACQASGISRAQEFYVDAADSSAVLLAATELSKTKEFLGVVDPQSLQESIFETAYGRGHYPSYQSHGCHGGVYLFVVYDSPAEFTAKSAKRYGPSKPGVQYPQAIVGHVDELLFTACKYSADGPTHFSVVQFGDVMPVLRSLHETPGLSYA